MHNIDNLPVIQLMQIFNKLEINLFDSPSFFCFNSHFNKYIINLYL